MGLPLVDDHRQVQLPGQGHLGPEGPKLNFSGDVLIVVVQADLSDGPDLGILPAHASVGFQHRVVHLIGGGVKDVNLCRFTANVTGKKVTAGPVEATAIGNIAVQLISQGTIADVAQARREFCSDDLKIYEPEDRDAWDAKYKDYLKYKWALKD